MSRKRINPGRYAPKHRADLGVLTRLLAKIKEDDHGCWVWGGYTDRHGYGQIRIEGRSLWVHRATYAIFKRSIPDGYEIDHKCKNPSCCNPAHLRAVEMKKNRATNKPLPPF
jgi:hypothetical protein